MKNTVVVVAHPDPDSLSHHVARELAASLTAANSPNELVDLAAEGFDPRWTMSDRAFYHGTAAVPAEIAAEQNRLDGASDVVLVFPVYWWSMPALLKGWIDRVFVNGWAFEAQPDGSLLTKLGGMTIHLVLVAAGDPDAYKRHGYDVSVTTQIEHGIIDFCGAKRGATQYLWETESRTPEAIGADVQTLADAIVRKDPAISLA
ncbi:NAD(P)H-dependent oxidoreductase [Rhodococcus wratislaviensis]|uniref:NAD(P)H-dependent oxidoreductase n=1 Tax=Rhodococcus wratislaviensis TaxID=44752 RepID=UPI00365CB8B9